MFEGLGEEARRALGLAEEESRRLGHNWLGTEHLLLGLMAHQDGIAARALRSFGMSLESLRADVERVLPRGRGGQERPSTPRAQAVLELSRREADQLGSEDIRTEHLLLGLVREGGGVAMQLLTASRS